MSRSFTSAAPADPVSFDLDGVTFVCRPVSALALAEWSASPTTGATHFFRLTLGDSYEAFRDHCTEHVTDKDTLEAILEGVLEDLTARPTGRAADSSSGQPTAAPRSAGGSSSRVKLSAGQQAAILLAQQARGENEHGGWTGAAQGQGNRAVIAAGGEPVRRSG